MISFGRRLLLISAFSLFLATPMLAQSGNVKTVEGPRGEKMTVTAQPHGVAEGLSVRAMGISPPNADTTRWALSLIGAAPEDSISLRYGEESLPITQINRPEGGVGPVKVYVSRQAFLTMAETSTVTLTVGGVSATLPSQLRQEMRDIFKSMS